MNCTIPAIGQPMSVVHAPNIKTPPSNTKKRTHPQSCFFIPSSHDLEPNIPPIQGKRIRLIQTEDLPFLGEGTDLEAYSVPISSQRGTSIPISSKKRTKDFKFHPSAPKKTKEKALLKLRNPRSRTTVKKGIGINRRIFNKYGKEKALVTKPPTKLSEDLFLQKLYFGTLADYNKGAYIRFKLARKFSLLIDAAKAIEQMFSCKYSHNDIKPPNIFITDRGEGRLGDFGLAAPIGKKAYPERNPYPYWDSYRHTHKETKATFATDIVGLAHTVGETILPDMYYKTDRNRFLENANVWRHIYIKRYATARLESFFCNPNAIIFLEVAPDILGALEHWAQTSGEASFCKIWAETKAINATFDFIEGIFEADYNFSQEEQGKNATKHALNYFLEPAEYRRWLEDILNTMNEDHNRYFIKKS